MSLSRSSYRPLSALALRFFLSIEELRDEKEKNTEAGAPVVADGKPIYSRPSTMVRVSIELVSAYIRSLRGRCGTL